MESTDLTLHETGAKPPAVLAIDPQQYVAAIYAPFEAKLASAVAASEAAEATAPNLKTGAGYAVAIAQRAVFRDEFRLAIEKARTERKAPILEIGRLIDAKAKEATAKAKPHEDKWDALIRAEDSRRDAERQAAIRAEQERVEKIKWRISSIHDRVIEAGLLDAATTERLREFVAALVIDASYAEFASEAEAVKATTLANLDQLLAQKQAAEAEAEAKRMDEERRRQEAEVERAKLAAERAELERQQAESAAALKAQQEDLARQKAALAAQRAEVEAKAQAEADRVTAIREALANLKDFGSAAARCVTAQAVGQLVAQLESRTIDPAHYQEFTGQALALKEEVLGELRQVLAAKEAQEAESARIAAERAELARQQEAFLAEQRAKAAAEAAEKAQAEAARLREEAIAEAHRQAKLSEEAQRVERVRAMATDLLAILAACLDRYPADASDAFCLGREMVRKAHGQ